MSIPRLEFVVWFASAFIIVWLSLVQRRQRQGGATNIPLSLRPCLAHRHVYAGVVILSLHLYDRAERHTEAMRARNRWIKKRLS
ncbi:hypothetical protein ARMGADRAFT_1014424 [Armillaria gallica]|uniref:Uncharacterized protein n=1 Tax=Armillaria gallica TaxID=47427 RepID=A0A2H3D9G0_ARMGA|nr:hypothetical protein ARMGADRAFT_1014424 [Armillaria gallica]